MKLTDFILLFGLFAGLLVWLACNQLSGPQTPPAWRSSEAPKEYLDLEFLMDTSEQHEPAISQLYKLIAHLRTLNPLSQFERHYVTNGNLSSKERAESQSYNKKCQAQMDSLMKAMQNDQIDISQMIGPPDESLFTAVRWRQLKGSDYCDKPISIKSNDTIKTRYCIGSFTSDSWKFERRFPVEPRLELTMCMPQYCNDEFLTSINPWVPGLWIHRLAQNVLDEPLILKSIFCLPDEHSDERKLPMGAKIYLYCVSGWLGLVIVASILDGKLKKVTFCSKLLGSLSLASSIKELDWTRKSKQQGTGNARVDLEPLNLMRCIMTGVVVFGHCLIVPVYMSTYSLIQRDFALARESWLAMSNARAVDFYFLLAGLLFSYSQLSSQNERPLGDPRLWLAANIRILLKVMPVFALIHLFVSQVSVYVSWGPWWDYGLGSHGKALCMASKWWRSIPLLTRVNQSAYELCIIPSWFIADYLQLCLIAPLLIYLLYRLPNNKCRLLFTSLVVAISWSYPCLQMYKQKSFRREHLMRYGLLVVSALDKFENSGYYDTLSRLGNVTIGCLLGFLLRAYQSSREPSWPKWMLSKTATALLALCQLSSPLVPIVAEMARSRTGKELGFVSSMLVLTAWNASWIISAAILLLRALTDLKGKPMVRFMSKPIWSSLNKLGLIIYLIHYELIMYTQTNWEPVARYPSENLKLFLVIYGVCVPMAALIYIFFQSPVTRLIRLLMDQSKGSFGGGGDDRIISAEQELRMDSLKIKDIESCQARNRLVSSEL